jgi:hypothetical protein
MAGSAVQTGMPGGAILCRVSGELRGFRERCKRNLQLFTNDTSLNMSGSRPSSLSRLNQDNCNEIRVYRITFNKGRAYPRELEKYI